MYCSLFLIKIFSIFNRLIIVDPLFPELFLLDWWNHAVHTPVIRGMFVDVIFLFDTHGAQIWFHDSVDTVDEG